MAAILVLGCSPCSSGSTVRAAGILEEALERCGRSVVSCDMSRLSVSGCTHCGFCRRAPHACRLAGQDDAEQVFDALAAAEAVLFVVPVYNYSVPACFKALIDRSQRFFEASVTPLARNGALLPAGCLMLAGRTEGRLLFEGVRLTMNCLYRTMGLEEKGVLQLRGTDCPQDISDEVSRRIAGFAADFVQSLS